MRILFIVLFTIQILPASTQNLVLNSDFEEYLICPKTFTKWNSGKILVPEWYYPTRGTPDYFNACSSTDLCSVPKNFTGKRNAHSGKAYVGLVLLGTTASYREYMQTALSSRLEENKFYCVSFYYSISDLSGLTINRLGVNFSEKKHSAANESAINAVAQVSINENSMLDSSSNWNLFCGYFKANGGEKYLTLGNFFLASETKSLQIHKAIPRVKKYCYILIDDIKVTKIDSCTNCKCYQSQLKLSVLDENEEFSASISYGEEPYIIKWSNGDTTKTIKKPKDGSYSISLVDAVGCKEELVFAVPFNNQAIEEDDPTSVTTLLQLKQGQSLKLEKILFESNSSLLLSNSFKELDSIVQFLDANSTYKIEISGYTDNVGDNSHNQKLSENRAQSIVDYLINSGIEDERLVAMGYGELFPVASNKTVSGRKLNRRVEVKLLYK